MDNINNIPIYLEDLNLNITNLVELELSYITIGLIYDIFRKNTTFCEFLSNFKKITAKS